jgi:hypothetical protein
MGGQTSLNCALSLRRMGALEKFDVEMIGANAEAIDKAEDRALFRDAMTKIGLETPRSKLANASELKRQDRDRYRLERAYIEGRDLSDAQKKQALACGVDEITGTLTVSSRGTINSSVRSAPQETITASVMVLSLGRYANTR